MGSQLMQLLKQILLLAQGAVPESLRPMVNIVANLIGMVNLPAADPRIEKIAALTRDFIEKLRALEGITDATALMKARLVLELEFTRAWAALGLDEA